MEKIEKIEKKIEKIKQELVLLDDLQPGTLSKQYNVCGKPNCRCKADPPQKHGPYNQLSFNRKGKSSTKYVKNYQVATVRKQLKNYTKMRKLVDCWIELSTELCMLKLEREKS